MGVVDIWYVFEHSLLGSLSLLCMTRVPFGGHMLRLSNPQTNPNLTRLNLSEPQASTIRSCRCTGTLCDLSAALFHSSRHKSESHTHIHNHTHIHTSLCKCPLCVALSSSVPNRTCARQGQLTCAHTTHDVGKRPDLEFLAARSKQRVIKFSLSFAIKTWYLHLNLTVVSSSSKLYPGVAHKKVCHVGVAPSSSKLLFFCAVHPRDTRSAIHELLWSLGRPLFPERTLRI